MAVQAVSAVRLDNEDPLSGLRVGDVPEPDIPFGWAMVHISAASLNRHDLWSLRGVGLTERQLPMILGCDAAGVDDTGSPVLVHAVISDPDWLGDETLDPGRSLLSERHPGTFAERLAVPRRNLIPLPNGLSFTEAACLPTAWLTAYRMLFTQAEVRPGSTILVQGAGGGVSSALIRLASAAGVRVWTTSRSGERRERAIAELGADDAFEPGARLPERVDAVMESVGAATWGHSLRSLRPGGVVVCCGATTGWDPSAELNRVFFLQLRVLGSTMGTRDELSALTRFVADRDVRPLIDRELPLDRAPEAFAAMEHGELFGKVVLTVDGEG